MEMLLGDTGVLIKKAVLLDKMMQGAELAVLVTHLVLVVTLMQILIHYPLLVD